MRVLVVNCGSSSLKYQLFETESEETLAAGLIERIGQDGADAIVHHLPAGRDEVKFEQPIADHNLAAMEMTRILCEGEGKVLDSLDEIAAVGHRVVHGGEDFASSVLIDDAVIQCIERNAALAPLHNPPNLAGIRACMKAMPGKPNVAVFDTAFHQTMPRKAYLYAIPRAYYDELGIRRYGFHGTSHFYVDGRARAMLKEMGRDGDSARIVTCHLGNGCSMAAIKAGSCVDTTMGLTPLEGCVMGTRSGDIDPAIIPFLGATQNLSFKEIDTILNKKSGLLGLSGISNDMRDVQTAAAEGNTDAAEAFEVFCYRVRKYIGAYAAAMGGLDAVVFTAGIGENDGKVRHRVLENLEFLGIHIDPDASDESREDRVLTTPESSCIALVIGTKEELVIARQTEAVCGVA
jgi:acetate kinase